MKERTVTPTAIEPSADNEHAGRFGSAEGADDVPAPPVASFVLRSLVHRRPRPRLPRLRRHRRELRPADWAYWIGFLIGFYFFISFPVLLLVVIPMVAALITWIGRGRTPGKALGGIAVRDAGDCGLVPFHRVYLREAYRGAMLLLIFPWVLDYASALRDPLVRTKHDRKAGTIVVRTRRARGSVSSKGSPGRLRAGRCVARSSDRPV